MHDELKRLARDCWRSRMGRAFFLVSLLVSMTCVGSLWSNMGSTYFDDVRKIFFYLHGFSILRMERLYAQFGRPAASRLTDGVLTLLFCIPWWLYGYGAEVAAAKIRELLGYSSGPQA